MNRRSAGFTLIEMMVALVVSMIMVVPLYILTRDLNRQADSQAKGVEAMQRARTGLSVISEDLRRAGLSVSPNPENDFASFTRNLPTANGFSRRAVVHLNPDNEGNDSILLVGNFLGSNTYRALAQGNQLVFQDAITNPDDCLRQFSEQYAFAHVFGPNNASVDMQITGVSYVGQICTLTIGSGERTEQAYADGDEVWVAANQAVQYQVEPVIDAHNGVCNTVNNELVRYFVDYTSTASSPCDNTLIPATRQVVASYVSDFQIWFRPVTPVQDPDNRTRLELHGYAPGDLYTAGEAFTPPASDHYFPEEQGGAVSDADFGCSGAYVYGPEHARSAVIRLSARTETPEVKLDFRPFLNDPTDPAWEEDKVTGRLPLFTLAPYVDDDVANQCPQSLGAAYKLKTVVTEIAMPNIAARSDILATN